MIQSKKELDLFHENKDPWSYETNAGDLNRKEVLLNEIPQKPYKNVLDIGCGQGFITQHLPGETVWGIDISQSAIAHAKQAITDPRFNFSQGSIFEIDTIFPFKFDLIIISGVLYDQYIGDSSSLIYLLIDKILEKDGLLITVHINEWYNCLFPYVKINQTFYMYREFIHNLEIYSK